MLSRIVSGGQTGADRAALDVAIKFNIPHGGWITKGRRTEDGPLPEIYQLREMTTADYPSRTRQNIIDSQGTVIVSRGSLRGGSKLTWSFARVKGKPVCHLDLLDNDTFEAAIILQSFILENQIGTLNVAGPRASHDPGIYYDVKSIIEAVLYLIYLESDKESELTPLFPQTREVFCHGGTIDGAARLICHHLPLRSKSVVARMPEAEIGDLYFAWMDVLRNSLDLENDKEGLVSRLANEAAQGELFTIEDAIMAILKTVKDKLTANYRLRIVE
ncbi:MAG: putative molybdenum carrier protein [Desulfobacterales bacterium]|nr:putative molybdenum carrier protein [Desulfobacterales bacterium]